MAYDGDGGRWSHRKRLRGKDSGQMKKATRLAGVADPASGFIPRQAGNKVPSYLSGRGLP